MATTTAVFADPQVALPNVSWETYERLLEDLSDCSAPRLTYDRGRLEIMSPTPEHEKLKRRIEQIVDVVAAELDARVDSLGSTTFKREDIDRGFEPDSCFYVAQADRVRGKKRIDLDKDPPPDLVIEIDITHRSIPRLPIYADLGVPEIWRYDSRKLQCLLLDNGEYRESEFSRAFPRLRVGDLLPFIRIAEEKSDQTAAVKALRSWLRKQKWVR